MKVEPIGRNLSIAGFEGGGTVARWDGSGLREEEQPDPMSMKATGRRRSCVASTGANMRRPGDFSNHLTGMAAMLLMHVKLFATTRRSDKSCVLTL